MQTFELRDGGILLYDESFLPSDLADRYFVTIRDECVWEQKPGIFGHMQPRLTASYGDQGVTYRYSGTVNSGQDSMGMHADDEPEMGNVIGSLSLGATRTFRIKHNKTKETESFLLGHGSLLIMAGTMQQFWKHEIPKTKHSVKERINLTYRQIVETA